VADYLPAQWTPRTAARRAIEVAREEGYHSLFFKILDETVYRRLALFELDLTGFNAVIEDRASVTLGILGEEHAGEYAALRPGGDPVEFRARLVDGHRCYAARYQGELTHVTWVAFERLWIPFLEYRIALAPDEACVYGVFTAPSARQQGIGSILGGYAARDSARKGYRRLLSLPGPQNRASIRLFEKLGYRRIGALGYVRLGPRRRHFCRTKRDARPPGISAQARSVVPALGQSR
jgi:GNAT superfamily N-acetyltransferase